MKRAVELALGNLAAYRLGEDAYDPDALGLGPLMIQKTGPANSDKFAGPLPIAVGRPMEASTPNAVAFPWAMQWASAANNKIDWVFLADISTAAATRRVIAYEFDRLTDVLTWKGFITITFPTATAFTLRALRMTYDLHTVGTVAVSGTAVTGTGTNWQSDRACVGNRIGFGSTDPTQITTWYEISAIGSNTGITLAVGAGTISAGTPYVIEDLRCVLAATNATATNGGLFVVKGLRYENFNSLGTAIPSAVSTDNIRACYWLKSAATVTETVAAGLGIQARTSFTDHTCWLSNGTTTLALYKFNLRAALTVATGASLNAFTFQTGVSAALTGTMSQNNNGRVANAAHGPGSGIDCFYWTTTTRIYRSKALSTIVASDTTHVSGGDNMVEIPPGGASTSAVSSLMQSIEYTGLLDRFVVAVNATGLPFRDYVTEYKTDSSPMNRQIGCDNRQINQSAADSGVTPTLTRSGASFTVWVEGGLGYFATFGTAITSNFLFVVPIGADWEYAAATNSRVILPAFSTTAASKYSKLLANASEIVGGDSGVNLGMATEPYRMYYRTAGIADNSGGWTAVDESGDLSAVAGATQIQFMFEFRVIGVMCVPSRLHAITVTYDDDGTDDRFQFSQNYSDSTNKEFTWRHAVAFGGTVPPLQVDLYDAISGGLLVSDDTDTPTGTFERSTATTPSFSAWTNTDKTNETTYIRYTPDSLADNITVRPVLRLKP